MKKTKKESKLAKLYEELAKNPNLINKLTHDIYVKGAKR